MNVYTNLYNAAVSLFDEIKTVSRLCFTWFFEPGVSETTRIKIFPKPVYSTVFYIEAHSFLPHVMATIGYGSSTGMPWKVKSYDETNFPTAAINDSELLQGWSISALFFQLDYSFAHHNNPDAPAISLSYVLPLAGRFFPKVYTLAGACAMSFTASF